MNKLLQKPMTRQEFLVTCGALVLGIVGISAIIKNISVFFDEPADETPAAGFGSGPYGL